MIILARKMRKKKEKKGEANYAVDLTPTLIESKGILIIGHEHEHVHGLQHLNVQLFNKSHFELRIFFFFFFFFSHLSRGLVFISLG
jgi:hypothetical protein